MSDETYNGWKNYPTWAVNLWLSNERALYEHALEIANDQYNDAPDCLNVKNGIWTIEEARRFNTADALKDFVQEWNDDSAQAPDTGMAADLYGWAMDHVEWHEVADAWLQTAQEAREYA